MKKINFLMLFLCIALAFAEAQPYAFVKEISGQTLLPSQYGFDNPKGIVSDHNDNIYVADEDAHLIYKFSSMGQLLKCWPVVHPNAIAVDKDNNIYVGQSFLAQVSVFTSEGVFLRKWGSYGDAASQMKTPEGIALDKDGNVYIADSGKNRIIKYTNNGTYIKNWGNSPTFSSLNAICADENNHIYVSDIGRSIVTVFDVNGTKLENVFWAAGGITSDQNGSVYIAKTEYSQAVIKINSSTYANISTFGTAGSGDGQFSYLCGITMTSNGNLYVLETDNGNCRVQVFSKDGQYLNKWGTRGNLDGQFCQPKSFCRDTGGNIYVSDVYGIQKLSASGTFITRWNIYLAAGITYDNGYLYVSHASGIKKYTTDGLLIKDFPKDPQDRDNQTYIGGEICVDKDGNMYVSGLSKMWKFSPEGVLLSKFSLPLTITGVIYDGVANTIIISASGYPATTYINTYNTSTSLLSSINLSRMYRSSGLMLDKNHNICLVNVLAHTINTYKTDGTVVENWGTFGCNQGQFGGISDLMMDDNGNLYTLEGLIDEYEGTESLTFGSYDRIQVFTPAVTTSVEDNNKLPEQDLIVFPNPCKGDFYVKCPLNKVIEKVTITNILGHQEYYYSDYIHTEFKGLIILQLETSDHKFYKSKVLIE